MKNLDESINDEKLKEIFSEFGNVTSCKVMVDPQGVSKGSGFVAFSSPEEATKALSAMNGKMVGRKPLYVAVAQRKEERRAHLQAQFAQARAPAPVPSGVPGFHPGAPRIAPQPLYFGQGAPGILSPQPAGFGFQQPLLPGMRPGMAPNFLMPYQLHRQGQPGPRVGARRPVNAQQMQPQVMHRNSNQGYSRYMANGRNAGDPSLVSPAPMGQVVPMPLDVSGMPAVVVDVPRNMQTLASTLASANPEMQRMLLGEQLFPLVERLEREHAGKVTGMLLEINQTEVLNLRML